MTNKEGIKYIQKDEQGKTRVTEIDPIYVPIVEKIRKYGIAYVGELTDEEATLASHATGFFDNMAKKSQKSIEKKVEDLN